VLTVDAISESRIMNVPLENQEGQLFDVPGMRGCLRPYRTADAHCLAQAADDVRVSRWMTAGFAHPYTLADAERWIERARQHQPPRYFAIEIDGAVAGGAGLEPQLDAHAGVVVLGYWLGTAYWGRGVMTAVVRTLVEHAFARGFRRIEAGARVLEKCGFTLEGRLRASYVDRYGNPCDELVFARVRE
jgi:RimJ/RimL family protein N-acetyltransferase